MTDTMAEVIETLEALTKSPGTDEFDRGSRAARLDALDMLRPLAAQPSAGAQGEATPHQMSRHADTRTEFAAARLGVKTDDLIDALGHFGLSIADLHGDNHDLVQRLFGYSDQYDKADPASVLRAQDMVDAAGLLNYYATPAQPYTGDVAALRGAE